MKDDLLGVWTNEGGLQLVLHRKPDSSILVEIQDVSSAANFKVLASTTIAPYRLERIGQFFLANLAQ